MLDQSWIDLQYDYQKIWCTLEVVFDRFVYNVKRRKQLKLLLIQK